MRTPPKPPQFAEAFESPTGNPNERQEYFEKFLLAYNSKEISEFLRTVSQEHYYHWDKFRFYSPLPKGLDAIQAWIAISVFRNSQRVEVPITFSNKKKMGYVPLACNPELLRYIDLEAGGNIGISGATFPRDQGRYLYNSLMEEAIASSQLEGASTTRQIAKELLRTERKPKDKAEKMIVNNYRAMLEIRKHKRTKLTPKLICHFQSILVEGTLDEGKEHGAGKFRTASDRVQVEDTRTREVLHIPPDAEKIDQLVNELCEFANSETKPWMNPVVKGAILHFIVGFIHPFVDGNGRTARAIFYWYMLKNGLWLFEYLPISRIIIKAPAKYSRAYLYTETDGGDLTYFIRYNVQCVATAVKALHEYMEEEVEITREAEMLLHDFPDLNHRQRAIVSEHIRGMKNVITIASHQKKFNISQPTSIKDLNGLAKLKLLQRVKARKLLRYLPPNNIRDTVLSSGKRKKKTAIPEAVAVTVSEKLPSLPKKTRQSRKQAEHYTQTTLFDLLRTAEK